MAAKKQPVQQVQEAQVVEEKEVQKSLSEKISSIRTLRAGEIECRIGTIKEKGCSLLLYKDARADMRLLDETVGPLNWKRHHEVINDNLFCTISIYDEDKKEWITKQDVGTESYTEKEKGQASDAFKRAAVNWGIGRELYTAPFTWVSFEKGEAVARGSSFTTYTKFSVSQIEYNENREITKLVIVDDKGTERFSFPKNVKQQAVQATQSAYTGAQLSAAIKEMQSTTCWDDANEVWKKYPIMHNDKDFQKAAQIQSQKLRA